MLAELGQIVLVAAPRFLDQAVVAQGREAVYGFLDGRERGFAGSVTMFYPAVVLEKGNVPSSGFDAEDVTELVVHFDRDRAHCVAYSAAMDADVIAIAQFVLIIGVELFAKEGGDIVGFDGVDDRAQNVIVDGLQVALAVKNDVGGILDDVEAPMAGFVDLFEGGAVNSGEAVQLAM